MKEETTIYNLELHETMTVKCKSVGGNAYLTELQVTRVPSGWIYQDHNPRRENVSEFFVPFDNKFQES